MKCSNLSIYVSHCSMVSSKASICPMVAAMSSRSLSGWAGLSVNSPLFQLQTCLDELLLRGCFSSLPIYIMFLDNIRITCSNGVTQIRWEPRGVQSRCCLTARCISRRHWWSQRGGRGGTGPPDIWLATPGASPKFNLLLAVWKKRLFSGGAFFKSTRKREYFPQLSSRVMRETGESTILKEVLRFSIGFRFPEQLLWMLSCCVDAHWQRDWFPI